MYQISVPMMNANVKRGGRDEILCELKKLDACRVILALDTYELDNQKRVMIMEDLKDNCAFFHRHGFEVGAWIWTFMVAENPGFTNMRTINGKEQKNFICPSDPDFLDFASKYIEDIARCQVDVILFDDDFRYGFFEDSPACLCDNHMDMIRQMTGKEQTREQLKQHIISGSGNIYRDAYLKANGDSFRNFAKRMRKAVDSVNPTIRMGACACMTSWDIDGVDAKELAYILAGSTKPIVRLIGAPYWAIPQSWGIGLQDIVELERMESAWTTDQSIEILAEGDVYPRPRSMCPASYLEGFDTAIRAAGCTSGILKYALDYHANAGFETGYRQFHERNKGLYRKIDAYFSQKSHMGVRVWECQKKISNMVMPTKVNDCVDPQRLFFSKAASTLASNSIPTVYEGTGNCGIVFDENARNLPFEALKKGLIMDIAAAEILSERGIDVGLQKIGQSTQTGNREHFLHDDNYVFSLFAPIVYDIDIAGTAVVLSDIETDLGTLPMSYAYENANGNRFLVLNVNTRPGLDAPMALKNYARSRQFADMVPWLSGKKLPAYCYGHPGLYIQCKSDQQELSVGLWNFYADIAIHPVVELSKEFNSIQFINGHGKLIGDRVILDDIPAFGFAGFSVK